MIRGNLSGKLVFWADLAAIFFLLKEDASKVILEDGSGFVLLEA